MYRSFVAPLVAAAIITSASATTAQALDVNEEFHRMIGTQNSPLDSLFAELSVGHIQCFLRFGIARLSEDAPSAEGEQSKARRCQADHLQSGNAAISKMKDVVPKPAAQSALKELALYWRTQMADIGSPHSDDEEVEILRRFKSFVERIRIESEW